MFLLVLHKLFVVLVVPRVILVEPLVMPFCIKRVVLFVRKDQATFCSNGSFPHLNYINQRLSFCLSCHTSQCRGAIRRGLTLILIWVTRKVLWSCVDRITLAFFLPLSVRKPRGQPRVRSFECWLKADTTTCMKYGIA